MGGGQAGKQSHSFCLNNFSFIVFLYDKCQHLALPLDSDGFFAAERDADVLLCSGR